jgi:hypothetical protein
MEKEKESEKKERGHAWKQVLTNSGAILEDTIAQD